jgi:hypothetical protein
VGRRVGGVPTSLRHDREFLLELARKIDEVQARIEEHFSKQEGVVREYSARLCTWMADLRDYFLYLTLDALEDAELSRELVGILEELDAKSRTHGQFFFALSQLLSVRHGLSWLGGLEKIGRDHFERSWGETARELGLVPQGREEGLRRLFLATLEGSAGVRVEWWERERYRGRELVAGEVRIPVPDDRVVCDVCSSPVTEFPAPVLTMLDLPGPTLRVEGERAVFTPFSGRLTLCGACWEAARRILREKGWKG